MRNSLFDDDPLADKLLKQSIGHLETGEWVQALDTSLALLQQRRRHRGELTAGDRLLIELVSDLAVCFGMHQGADDCLKGLEADNRATGLTFAADYIALKRVHLALGAGHNATALARLEQLESRIGPLDDVPWQAEQFAAWEQRCQWPGNQGPPADRALFLSRLYLCLGQWLASEGCYAHAALLLERGLKHARPPSSMLARRAWRPLQLALAEVLLEQGCLADCRRMLARLESSLDPRTMPGWFVQWLELAGQCRLLAGEYGEALEKFAQVVAMCSDRGFARATLVALVNEAEVLIPVNQLGTAEDLLAEARQLAHRLGDQGAQRRVDWLLRLAGARSRLWMEGKDVAPSVAEIWEELQRQASDQANEDLPPSRSQPQSFLALFEDRALELLWALSLGKTDAARNLLASMQQAFGQVESHRIQVRLEILAGMVDFASHEYAEAAGRFDKVCPALERLGLQPELAQVLRLRGDCAARLGQPDRQQRRLARQTQALVARLADSLKPAQRAIYLLNKWTVEEKDLSAELQELQRLEHEADAARWYARPWKTWRLWKRRHSFLDRIDENRRKLAAQELDSKDGTDAQPRRSLLRWLWRDSATLSFLVLPDRVLVVCATRFSIQWRVCPVTRITVHEMVERWHTIAQAWRYEELPAALLDELSADVCNKLRLPELLEPLPARIRRLTIVADHALHGFPFAALPHGDGYLFERFALSMSHDRCDRRHRPAATPLHKALVVAVSRELDGEGALQFTESEAERVAGWLLAKGLNPRLLVNDDASRNALLSALPEMDFALLACHGTFEPDRPDASGLVLTAEPGRSELLSLRDLAGLDLHRLQHVSLSSCWGADNFVLPGRWIISLPETLCRRGAGSVLACLWPVDDAVGEAFSARFHELLAEMPRDEALQQTQRECLRQALHEDAGHPCIWAGYVLHGNATRLRFPFRVSRAQHHARLSDSHDLAPLAHAHVS